jgi:tetratricopeptide (TPR) repeat protein
MKLFIFISIIIFINSGLVEANDFDSIKEFNDANRFYSEKNYSMANEIYSKLLENGYDNFNINFNRASSLFELGRYGQAKFYYLIALKKNPFDKELITNIKVTYKKLGEDPANSDPEIVFARFLYLLSPTLVFILVIISLIFFIISIILFNRAGNRRILLFSIIFSILAIFFTVIYTLQYRDINSEFFIVTAKEANCYNTPNSGDFVLITLREGTRLKIIDKTDNFVKTDLNNGLFGWIEKSNIIF